MILIVTATSAVPDANTATSLTTVYDPRPSYLDFLHDENRPKKGQWKGKKTGLELCRKARVMLLELDVPLDCNSEDQLDFLQRKDKNKFNNWKKSDVAELLSMISE